MSRIASRTRLPLRLLAGMFGILLLTYLVRRAGPTKLLESMATLGWGLTLVIALGGASHVVKTWAWRLTLLDEKHQVSFVRMFGLRLVLGSSWAARRPGTAVRGEFASLTSQPDDTARQRDRIRGA